MRLRSWTELRRIKTFEERYEYLRLRGAVGDATFGFDRHINQQFYRSVEWRRVRQQIIARDLGCDLGIEGYEIHDRIYIHHMNPMNVENIVHGDGAILDPEYLITTTHRTHNAIHYGDERLLRKAWTPRQPGDTQMWGNERSRA